MLNPLYALNNFSGLNHLLLHLNRINIIQLSVAILITPHFLRMKIIVYTFILCFFCAFASAQNITGYWKGISTQNEGAYSSEYVFELWLSQKGDTVVGKAFIFVDSIYAEMNVSGSLESGIYLKIQDDEIVEHQELQGMEWCIKTYQLLLKQLDGVLKLEGHWQGVTSFSSCTPGRIYLKKTIPRA